jgi:hypothetical protein
MIGCSSLSPLYLQILFKQISIIIAVLKCLCDSRLMSKPFLRPSLSLLQVIRFRALMEMWGCTQCSKSFSVWPCVSFEMLVSMYLISFPSVFTRALAFIAGGINSSSQAGALQPF